MAKKDRCGTRKERFKVNPYKSIKTAYYLIFTDTEATERCFFEGFYEKLPKEIKDKITLKVINTKTAKMIDKCLEMMAYEAQYRMPWIVFDRDEVVGFDKIVENAEKNGINVGWSNPCFEIWMYAYYGEMPKIEQSSKCCLEFSKTYKAKTGQEYSKSDKQLYAKLSRFGDENKAIQIAEEKWEQCLREEKTKPSKMCPCTAVYKLVKEIKG